MANVDVQKVKQRFGIIGNSPLLNRAIEVAVQVAPTDMSVLIMGESGVGKETFPKIIHQNSQRKHNVYIAVNCGAIPEGTIDSELFGHLKGAFTGAFGDRKGYFEEANGGTIFLDEVGELPLATQARLLRVLETGEFIPVGASKALKADVRIVAATNVNLKQAVEKGRFREDLLFRLNTVPIEVPPLRDRATDIPLLFRFFASKASEKYSMPAVRLSKDAEDVLENYRWPGNIRELRNITDRISILESDRIISASTLENYIPKVEPMQLFPQKVSSSGESTSFATEREILYQILFDMKKDMAEMKILISNILNGKIKIPEDAADLANLRSSMKGLPALASRYTHDVEPLSPVDIAQITPNVLNSNEYDDDTLSYEEHPQTLQEVEKSVIASSMRRNNGVRRAVAKELKIAERTLYRKLKEYELDKEF